MNTSNNVYPSPDEVRGWNKDTLIKFLQNQKLMIDAKHITTLDNQEVSGPAFLLLTERKLCDDPYKLTAGPASIIADLVNKINGRKCRSTESTESNESNEKRKLDPLFKSICDVVKNQRDQLYQIQSRKQADIIEHTETLAVIEKRILFVRPSYKLLYNKLKEKSYVGLKRFLITGWSGIGKSCFLIYALIQLLREDFTVIFQPINGEHLYCFKNLDLTRGKYEDFLDLFASPEIWYLADGITSPKSTQGRTVIALSPHEEYQQFDKRYVKEYWMEPWALKELKACRQHVFSIVPEEIVTNLYHELGGIPREVLEKAEDSLKDVVGIDIGKEGRPNDEEKEEIEKRIFKCTVEYVISELMT